MDRLSKGAVLAMALALALALAAGPGSAHAGGRHGGRDWEDAGHSYDRARRASERGEILSLTEIYRRAATRFPGRVLEAELELESDQGPEQKPGHWVYELKILDPGGRLLEGHLDAHSGAILDQEEDD